MLKVSSSVFGVKQRIAFAIRERLCQLSDLDLDGFRLDQNSPTFPVWHTEAKLQLVTVLDVGDPPGGTEPSAGWTTIIRSSSGF